MTNAIGRLLTYRGIPLWRDVRVMQAVAQIVSVVLVVSIVVFLVANLFSAADDRGLSLGFDFLQQEAGFPIGESIIDYEPADSFQYAFGVGILNTLKASLLGVFLATVLGVFVGLARLSPNWLLRNVAGVYIQTFRNIPLLVQLFFWYFAVFQAFPLVQEAIRLPGPVFLSNRGMYTISPVTTSSFGAWFAALTLGVVVGIALRVVLARRERRTGRPSHAIVVPWAAFVVIALVGWFAVGDSPLVRSVPVLGQFNFAGGMRITPEFGALLVGLVLYTATFIAEIVRAGVQSVSRGQTEASLALGLTDAQTIRLVVLPQALRVIVPPVISQYLNLTKNSSLAVAIAYPELFTVGKTMINQAGRALPIFLLIMAAYLAMSLTWAAVGNLYNRRVQLVDR
jgi:general L-amino acid transport system permease protein